MPFQRSEVVDDPDDRCDSDATPVNSSERAEVQPDKEEGSVIVVEWYGDDDPENPQNW